MNRVVVLDTETTGLDINIDRIIEIGCIELIDKIPTGRSFQVFIQPETTTVKDGAFAVHGISDSFLYDKKTFPHIVDDFLNFIGSDPLVIHNAAFDTKFLNKELTLVNKPTLTNKILDTLTIARDLFPGKKCSLDALCKRLKIRNEERKYGHGALKDAFILGRVYFFLSTYFQEEETLILFQEQEKEEKLIVLRDNFPPRDLNIIVSDEEKENHQNIINKYGIFWP